MGSQSLGPTHRDSSEDHYRLPWGQDDIFGRANVNDSDSVEKENTEAEHGVWRVLMWKDQHFLSKNNRGGLSPGCTGWRQGALGLKMQPPELSCQEWNLAPVTRSPCDRGHVIYRLCVSVSFSAE